MKGMYEDRTIERRKFQWKVFIFWCTVFVAILLLLPLNTVITENGGLATWFMFYITSGASVLMVFGVLIKTQKFQPANTPAPLPDVEFEVDDLEGLDSEDKELLRSLRELREWYMESLGQATTHRGLVHALERWYRLGIAKDIEIRNLKRALQRLREESIQQIESKPEQKVIVLQRLS